MNFRFIAPIALAALVASAVAANDYRAGNLSIAHPWTRQTAPGQSVGGGFMTITNSGSRADRLISATSPASDRVEIHTMSMDGGVMRMRPVSGGLAVPASGRLELKPGGYHIMLIGLKAPLELGKTIPLTLRFERAGPVQVQVKVEAVTYGMGGDHDAH
jgi:copper(I)-binding protein